MVAGTRINTTPCLTIRFEAQTIERLQALQAMVKAELIAIDASKDAILALRYHKYAFEKDITRHC